MNRLNEAGTTLVCELAAEVVGKFGRVRLRVSGTSMTPAVRPGDLLSIERAAIEEISHGEIVMFERSGRLFVHRVAAIDGTAASPRLLTRGDRRRQNDPPVSAVELLGRVALVERAGKRLSPRTRLSLAQRALTCVLRASDRATSLYLRALPFFQSLTRARTEWAS